MAFGSAFRAVANDPWGEAAVPRVRVRDKSAAVTVISGVEAVLGVGEIERKRERQFGVVQGTPWQVKLTNEKLALMSLDLPGCWCSLEAGFPAANQWELLAQGRIQDASASTDMTITTEIDDSVMDVLNFALPRDMHFQATGWAGDIQPSMVSANSAEYDNTVNAGIGGNGVWVVPANNAHLRDETFRIVFTSATAYKIVREDGTESTGHTIGTDATFGNMTQPSLGLLTIKAAGWDATAGAYVTSDEFLFYTSRARTSTQLSTIGMVAHLLEDVAGLTAWDVIADAAYSRPLYQYSTQWTAGITAHSTSRIEGFWPKDTRLVEMVQEALMLAHASIYAAPTGQVALAYLQEAGAAAATLNGDPALGTITILSGTVSDNLEEAYNRVSLTYLSLNRGAPALVQSRDPNTEFDDDRHLPLKTSWRVSAVTASDCVYKAISRFKDSRRLVTLQTTLAACGLDIDATIAVTDPILGLVSHLCGVVSVAINVMAQTVTVQAYRDNVAAANYARVGTAKINGTALIW